MAQQTIDDENETEYTRIDAARLTPHEIETVIPERDHVVVGYDSNFSDKDVSTQTVADAKHGGFHKHHVRGQLVGHDPDDESRGLGIAVGDRGGTFRSSGNTLGTLLYVEIPEYDEIEKVDALVRFTVELGGRSYTHPAADQIESLVARHDYDHLPYDVDDSDAELVEWEIDHDRTVTRARFDLVAPVTLPADAPLEAYGEKAKAQLPSTIYDAGEVPELGEHKVDRDQEMFGARTENLRRRDRIVGTSVEIADE